MHDEASYEVLLGATLVCGLLFGACSGSDALTPAGSPARIAVVSGDHQVGREGELLNAPFMVRVTNARGEGLSGIEVNWRVTAGSGELRTGLQVRGSVTHTDHKGVAKVSFVPTIRGMSVVVEAVPIASDFVGVGATFTTSVLNVAVIRFGPLPMTHCESSGSHSPFIGPHTVAVGTTVEWVYAESMPAGECAARLASISAPPAGAHFDSGFLPKGGRFQFVPHVPGTWEYVDPINGGYGTLTAIER